MAQPIGDGFFLGGRWRDLWRNQEETVLLAAALGATYGASNRSPFYFDRFIFGGRGRNLWRNQ